MVEGSNEEVRQEGSETWSAAITSEGGRDTGRDADRETGSQVG